MGNRKKIKCIKVKNVIQLRILLTGRLGGTYHKKKLSLLFLYEKIYKIKVLLTIFMILNKNYLIPRYRTVFGKRACPKPLS